MIVYFDTSAIVPLLIDEPTSGACRRVWDDADDVATSRIAYVEAAAAIAQAHRLGRITARHQSSALRGLNGLWSQLQIVEIDQMLVERAALLAKKLALRGYDAMHAASAETIIDVDVVAAAGDRRLLEGWQALGLSTYDSNVS